MPILTHLGPLFLLCNSEFLINNKTKLLEDHPMNIPIKLGSNWPSGFREEYLNVKVHPQQPPRPPFGSGELENNDCGKPCGIVCPYIYVFYYPFDIIKLKASDQ